MLLMKQAETYLRNFLVICHNYLISSQYSSNNLENASIRLQPSLIGIQPTLIANLTELIKKNVILQKIFSGSGTILISKTTMLENKKR